MPVPRPEYPRPQFVRAAWQNLNGPWRFSFDAPALDRTIQVPFAYQTALSGVHETAFHREVWYERTFVPDETGGRLLLHFGAVDYRCRVWVNGAFVGGHTGGSTPFTLDVTDAVRPGENTLRVQAIDEPADLGQPRGKQYWKEEPHGIFYTPTTGIWQTVWLEPVPERRIERVDITPDFDERRVHFDYAIAGWRGQSLELTVSFAGRTVAMVTQYTAAPAGRITVALDKSLLPHDNFTTAYGWTPENPQLFDVAYRLLDGGETVDEVTSYFGMRKISIENGVLQLNNYPYRQKLVLDQGYWPESLLTAPDDQAFVADIEACKALGFNGARKHQKVEDPRYLYHADRLGFLVWGEMTSAYQYSTDTAARMTQEWIEVVRRDYNHPCIVAWTTLNESWGVEEIHTDPRMQAHSCALVHLVKSLDATRLVMANDGWEQTIPDVLGIHDYEPDAAALRERYGDLSHILAFRPAGRGLFARGFGYAGQPVMVTECGGVSYRLAGGAWSYSDAATEEEFYRAYGAVVGTLLECELVQGFCYTQLTDVQQEQNGLLTFDRRHKFDPARIRAINEGRWDGRA